MPHTTSEITGYVAFNHDAQEYLHFSPERGNYLAFERPEPASRGDVHRRIGAFLDANPDASDDFTVDAVFRELSPVERGARELAGTLQSLCSRHGINLNMTKEQIEAQLVRELQAFGAR